MKKVKKLKLDVGNVSDKHDFCLIGIISIVADYKLAWEINEFLHIELKKKNNIVVEYKQHRSKYIHFSAESAVKQIKLIKNKNWEKEFRVYFLPECPHFDYILFAKGVSHEEIVLPLSKSRSIQVCAHIPLKELKLKTKERFIF